MVTGSHLKALAGVALVLTAAGCAGTKTLVLGGAGFDRDGSLPLKAVPNPGNGAFYAADGAFDANGAKEAYFAMLRGFGYPIPPVLKTDAFWVADFVQRDFAGLGMGGTFWINENNTYGKSGEAKYAGEFSSDKFGYLGHEIFLLPGQVLPEHRHIGGPDGYGPKMESWQVRYGSVEFFGEYKGDGTEKPITEMPAAERPWGYGQPWFKSKYVTAKKVGDVYTLKDPESWHFQRAGKYGAVVTEYATYHNQVEFSKPGMIFASSEAEK